MSPELEKTTREEERFSFLDYLLPFIKWRWLIFISCALFGVAGLGYIHIQTPIYKATAVIMPRGAMGETSELSGVTGEIEQKRWSMVRSPIEVIRYYEVRLRTPPLMRILLDREFVYGEKGRLSLRDILGEESQSLLGSTDDSMINLLSERISLSTGGGKMVTVSYPSADAQFSADFVNELLKEYQTYARMGIVNNDSTSTSTSTYVSFNTQVIKNQLDAVMERKTEIEGKIAEIQENYIDTDSTESEILIQSYKDEAARLRARYAINDEEYSRATLRDLLSQSDNMQEIEIVEDASAPLDRSNMSSSKILIYFVFLGGALSVCFAFVVENVRIAHMRFLNHPIWGYGKIVLRDLIIMILITALAAGGAVGYLLYTRSETPGAAPASALQRDAAPPDTDI